jgi:hypothetical protein
MISSDFLIPKDGFIVYSETLIRNYRYTPRNNPEERRSLLFRGGSLKPGIVSRIVPIRGFLWQPNIAHAARRSDRTRVLIATWEVGRHLDPNYGGRGQNLISYK